MQDAQNAPEPDGQPKRGRLISWLLREDPPRSAIGILLTALAMWVPALAIATRVIPQPGAGHSMIYEEWFSIAMLLSIILALAAGLLSITGLGRVRRDWRVATTAGRKAVTLLAVLPLAAMAGCTMYVAGGLIVIAMLRR